MRLSIRIVVAAALALAAVPLAAQELPSVLSYRTVKVADGIYAFITPEERSGFQAGNSIAVIGDDGVLVFDTGNLPSVTRRQIAELRKLTDKPVRWVVNSHWHPDHNLGNAEYKRVFPNAVIVGTTATRDGIRDRMAGYRGSIQSFAAQDSLMRVRLQSGKMRDGSDMPAGVRAAWSVITRDYGEFIPEVMSTTEMPSEVTFDDSLTISLGRRVVKLVRPGRGNTAGDAYAVVPDAGVLLTGDLVTVPCPFPGTAFFSEWIAALDQLKRVGATHIVPGHGDVMHDYAYVDLTRALLAFTRDEARAAARVGVSADSLQKRIDFEPWVARFAGTDALRRESFNNFYRFASVPRAYAEAQLDAQTPIAPPPKKP
jgi:glyoxylase-like metal-dependent hydrolase (beta-lactamase superfamily II)